MIFTNADISVAISLAVCFLIESSPEIFRKLACALCFISTLLYHLDLAYVKSILMLCSMLVFFSTKPLSKNTYTLAFGLLNSIILCLSAEDFLILLIGFELGSFSICFLLMPNREVAVRFIIISAVMAGVLLYGLSLCYLNCNSLLFNKINQTSLIGNVLIISFFFFKLGLMPFHTWMIDVYEQAPLGLVMFFDTFWKLFMVIIFAKVFKVLEYGQVNAVLEIFAISSMLIGSIMAIFQNNIKRFIAYTSVGHIGFIMTVFIISSQIVHAITYALSYAFASVCFFISLQSLKRRIETFDDLAGTMNENPITGIGLIISMFAMIGMPPFINFTAKLQILKLQIETQYYTILAISIIYSILCILYATKTMKVFNK